MLLLTFPKQSYQTGTVWDYSQIDKSISFYSKPHQFLSIQKIASKFISLNASN